MSCRSRWARPPWLPPRGRSRTWLSHMLDVVNLVLQVPYFLHQVATKASKVPPPFGRTAFVSTTAFITKAKFAKSWDGECWNGARQKRERQGGGPHRGNVSQ